jgi:tetratricopeptide (TPR) repeat protein
MNLWRWISRKSPEIDTPPVYPRDLYPMQMEAHACLVAKNFSKAQQILLEAIEHRPGIIDSKTTDWILDGLERAWISQEKFDEQVAFFSDYVTRFPGDAAAYRGLGAALWYLERLPEAVADYSRAIELNPTEILSRSGRGQVLAEIGENEKALDDLEIALRLLEAVQKHQAAWVEWCAQIEGCVRRGRAVAFANQGKISDAMGEFDASLKLNPDNAWVYYSRAQVGDRLGDQKSAVADYNLSLAKDGPNLTPIQKERAQARLQKLGSTFSQKP